MSRLVGEEYAGNAGGGGASPGVRIAKENVAEPACLNPRETNATVENANVHGKEGSVRQMQTEG